MSHDDKARRYLEASVDHLRKALSELKANRSGDDLDLELWRAYSKAEFALFILSISDEEKRWAVEEKIAESASWVRLIEEAEQLLKDVARASSLSSQQSLAKIWKAENRMIHVSRSLQRSEQATRSSLKGPA